MSYRIGEWIPLKDYLALPATSGIYVIRHKQLGKEYVGLSVDVRRRVANHVYKPTKKSYIHRSIIKYGVDGFEVCFLQAAPAEALNSLEQSVIASRGTLAPAGYNLTIGGEGVAGIACTEATRQKLRLINLGRKASQATLDKMSKSQRGKVQTEEVKERIRRALTGTTRPIEVVEKMRTAMTGKTHSEEALQKMRAHAAKLKGVKRPAEVGDKIAKALTGRRLSDSHRASIAARQTGRKATEETRLKMQASQAAVAARLHKPVMMWEPNSLTPKIYESGKAAATALGLDNRLISTWCKKGRPNSYGQVFTFA